MGLQDSGGDVGATTDTEDNIVEEVSTVEPREEAWEIVDDVVKVARTKITGRVARKGPRTRVIERAVQI